MRFVHPLVVGRADEGLYRGSELDRVLGAKMQVEGSPVLEALNQLEMIGDIVPRDQDKFRYSWVRGAVGHEAQYERLCLIEKGRDDVYMSDDGSFPGRAGLSRHSRFDQRALAHVERSFVNVAARLEGIAEPGGICLSEDAFRQVRSRSAIPA